MKTSIATPIEPTPEMIDAGAFQLFDMLGSQEKFDYSYEEVAEAVFNTMLAHCRTAFFVTGKIDEPETR
jgi:hypothetical protein